MAHSRAIKELPILRQNASAFFAFLKVGSTQLVLDILIGAARLVGAFFGFDLNINYLLKTQSNFVHGCIKHDYHEIQTSKTVTNQKWRCPISCQSSLRNFHFGKKIWSIWFFSLSFFKSTNMGRNLPNRYTRIEYKKVPAFI